MTHSVSAAANPNIEHTTSSERGEHEHDGHDDIHDVTIYEWIAWAPLLIAIVVLGVYPQLMFRVMDPAVENLLRVFQK